MSAIAIQNLSKEFKNNLKTIKILDSLSLNVQEKEVFGFLGANGAGKTTTIKILMGLTRPSTGCIKVFGEDSQSENARKRMSFLPEHPQFPKNLTALEFLQLSTQMTQLSLKTSVIQESLDKVGLVDAGHKKISTFSKGMQQRLGIAQAILPDPDLLVLDEPMSGLDPLGRQEIAQLILDLKAAGKTVFFSTHILSDAQLLCDRISFLKKGQLLKVYQSDEFSKEEMLARTVAVTGMSPEALKELPTLPYSYSGNTLHIDIQSDEELWQVMALVQSNKAHLLSVSMNPKSIKKYWV